MNLIFEKSKEGRFCSLLPECDIPEPKHQLPEKFMRSTEAKLPQVTEQDISRHYTELAKCTRGVNGGFYPLGSCTMKYNPKINDEIAGLPGFTQIHPLQPANTVSGCLEVLRCAEKIFCEITGMDAMTFQPAAGAHGELTGLLLFKAYHRSKNDIARTKIIVPDAAHGTNPATASMVGYTVVNLPANDRGCVDLDKLRAAVGSDTAGLMLTNPNTLGIFDPNILEITKIIHDAGGLNYYDGANLNAIMGVARPGDMGFDAVHLNLHKTFSTPHGGGGPGSGAVGCKNFLKEFLPSDGFESSANENSIGRVKQFYGNFLVVVRALTYVLTLGGEGISDAARLAVLNANYLKARLSEVYDSAYSGLCMHEFVLTLSKMKKQLGVSALDVAKMLLDYGIHPPTMYFPLMVDEALMIEPTETESIETLDEAAEIFLDIYRQALADPESLHCAPVRTPVRRLDELKAARNPRLRWEGVL